MAQNNDSLAIMLLCCRMSATRQELFDPLSPQEYYSLAYRLRTHVHKTPEWLLGRSVGELMATLEITEQEAHRILVLMERMVSLSYELDSYDKNDIGIITCADKRYPARLTERLGQLSPPVLYVSGNMNLFHEPVLSFIGSVPGNADSEAETRRLMDAALASSITVATGATSGLDRSAESILLKNGGKLIAWLPGGFDDVLAGGTLRDMINERRAAALSIVHPLSPVRSSFARARSKCLYATGTVACLIGCEFKRGDTWEGASEALKNRYTDRLYCWDTDLFTGNKPLIERGAIAVADTANIDFRRVRTRWEQDEGEQLSVFDDRHLIY
ncbi:MAG: DNA-processing protein DprA [Clostridia bacterium]|nr:DNA-processing protein DprA [Clostridia bacterium]